MFNLKKSENELSSANSFLDSDRYQQYATSRDTTGSNFANGKISIFFNLDGTQWWMPSKSFLRLRCKLTKSDGVTSLDVGDNIGPNMNLCANLFASMELRLGGKAISTVPNFIPQIDSLKMRTTKSRAWMESVGATSNFAQSSLGERVQEVSADGRFLSQRQPLGDVETSRTALLFPASAELEVNGAQIDITAVGASPANDLPIGRFAVGQFIKILSGAFSGSEYRILAVPTSTAALTQLTIQGDAGAIGPAAFNFARVEKNNAVGAPARQVSTFELTWQPPLAIFDVEHALPCGAYELVMTPLNINQFQLSAIESIGNKTAADFKFEVQSMFFYCNQVTGPRIENTKYYIDLKHIRCQTVALNTTSFTQKAFDVASNVQALSLAFQDGRIDETRFAASKFKAENDDELKLQRVQIDFGSQQKPSPDGDLEFKTGRDFQTAMYMETLLSTGAYFADGGTETIQEWRARGPYYYFPWPRDGSNQDTRVRVSSGFDPTAVMGNMRMLLFEHSSQVAIIDIKDARVVDVQLQDM